MATRARVCAFGGAKGAYEGGLGNGGRPAQANKVKPPQVKGGGWGLPEGGQGGKRVNNRNAGRAQRLPCVHPLVGDTRNIGSGRRGGRDSRAACRERSEYRQVIGMAQGCAAAHPQAREC